MILRLLAAALTLAIFAVVAHAHPGRLNKDGCHETRAPYEYANGTRLPAGFYHCHRVLTETGMPLDGTQLLEDQGELDPRRVVTKLPDGRFFICESDGRGNRQCGAFDTPTDSPYAGTGW